MMPNSEYIKRGKVDMKQLVKESNDKEYTHVVVINEDMKKPSILYIALNRRGGGEHLYDKFVSTLTFE